MIRLHYLEGCPYCDHVIEKLKELKLKYKLIDAEKDNFERVLKIAEHDMVPVIEDGEKVIQDSSQIISYLEDTYEKVDR